MIIDFTQKTVTVVITGGAGGIGRACAKEFLESGAKVVLLDISREALERTKAELGGLDRIYCYAADISDSDAVKKTVRDIRDEAGEIDVLIQTAALLHGKKAFDITDEDCQNRKMLQKESYFLQVIRHP